MSLIAGAGMGDCVEICPQPRPKRHSIQNSADTSINTTSRPLQYRSFKTFRALSFIFMPPT